MFRTILITLCFFSSLFSSSLETSGQVIVVTSDNWESNQASIECFEKKSGKWKSVLGPFKGSLGKNGMAWGRGIHKAIVDGPQKVEGDYKTPAGIFEIGTAFGHTNRKYLSHIKLNYFEIAPESEAVDDPNSIYYNRIVNLSELPEKDWNQSEKMGEIAVYHRGFFIHHNYDLPLPELGSAIFFHLWSKKGSPTAGCTACSFQDLELVLNWLDKRKSPLIIQLPKNEYREKQSSWSLPRVF
ncbi:MAG: hypothetical protein GWP59_04615 [Chlamydiales bacterium]|nr:hypothetical protein [Chlamydiales bacterium]